MRPSLQISGVAVVTGAGRGLGAAIARRLAERGASVVLGDLDEAAANASADALRNDGHTASAVRVDVASESSIEGLADYAAGIGPIGAWVNNAGISERAALTEMTLPQWERMMTINAGGTFLGTRAAARRMLNGGSIVNIASISAVIALPHLAHYGASKGAIVAFTKHAAIDLAEKNIRVNAIAPGTTRTAMTEARLSTPGQTEWTINNVPLRRIALPDDIAGAVAFLCSPEATFITGVLLPCDGGWIASA